MKAIDDYLAAVQDIKAATLAEKIVWKKNKPNCYVFKTINHDLEDLVLTLQRIDMNGGYEYKFGLVKQDFDNIEILLSLDTSTNDVELKKTLCELYNFVEYHVDIKNLDGLREFIDDVNSGENKKTILG
ncbi:MAG: hypothetical protein BalsKO_23080 [Balneolaceae bacterium]